MDFGRARFVPMPYPLAWADLAERVARTMPELAVLVGDGTSPRGRFGLVAPLARVTCTPPTRTALREACSAIPKGTMRLVLAGYESGYPLVTLDAPTTPGGQPYGLVADVDAAVVIDHARQAWALVGPEGDRYAFLAEQVELVAREGVPRSNRAPAEAHVTPVRFTPLVSDDEHARRVSAVRELIAAGEIYQANVTRTLVLPHALEPLATLVSLHERNPVAHGAWLRTRETELVSNSMETLVTLDGATRVATSHPIKGTRRRGTTPSEDRALVDELRASAKERSEHVMIVDLVRNDLGRVALPGSVVVRELVRAEPYQNVWQLVSDVQSTLEAPHDAGSLLEALFPGGSITGAPKRRAVELLHELEGAARGFYTGTLAWLDDAGGVSASILIRTLVRDARGWTLGVGGGIVYESEPAREVEETWVKAEVFSRGIRSVS